MIVLPSQMNPDKMSERELRNEVKRLRSMEQQRDESDHYGPFGPVCQNTGQFDSGECYICERNRLREVVKSKERQIEDLVVRAKILQGDTEKYKAAKGDMQLVAGRYQFQFEHAMKCINSIDDLFEYAYKGIGRTKLREMVRNYLAVFTAAVKPRGK